MQIEVVEFMILDEDERRMLRDSMRRCHPVDLTEDQRKVRNRMCDEKKYDKDYVRDKALPYLEWLLAHYQEELRHAEEHKSEAKEWEIIIDTRKQMIPEVEEAHELFTMFMATAQ